MKKVLNCELVKALAAFSLCLIAAAISRLFTGKNPLMGYVSLFRGGLMNAERSGNTHATATPLILTGLSVAFAFRTGLFNIGASGQMLIGGLCATAIGLSFSWPRPLLLLVISLSAILGGAIWGIIPGFLKARFNVNEVVATIMMNWIAYWSVYYIVPAYFKGEYLETESARLPELASLKAPWLTGLFAGSYINLGLFLAIAAVAVISFLLNRTTLGYELKAVGFNRHASEYAGISVSRNVILSMMIAGALAGLAGATFYTGYASNIQIGVLPTQGADGIAVSLLGANSPWGVLAAAIFFGMLHSGKGFMNAMTKIPPDISDTIIAIIIYFTATSLLIEKIWIRLRKKKGGKA